MTYIKKKKKICKGSGKAEGFKGCGELKYIKLYGLCSSCLLEWDYSTGTSSKVKQNMQKKYFSNTRKNKFNAKKTQYNGRYYDSILEANYAEKLDWLKKAGDIKTVTPQYKIPLAVKGVHIANYYMDFKVELPDGRIEMHEVKGAETQLWRMKWRIAQALFPEWNFILIK